MEKMYPMRLRPVCKSPIWGGTRLLQDFGKDCSALTLGESWELTVRPSEVSRVENGVFAGMRLDEVIKEHKNEITGGKFGVSDFPLLIKLIDAGDRLSVQVHPDDAYAKRIENGCGKTEMWYIVEAEAGAELILGLKEGVNAADFAKAVTEGKTDAALRHVPVHAGECYFIPAGLVHAIGRGILLAEIQQNCDCTYRVYDYERRDSQGNLRELHIQKALDVIRSFSEAEIEAARYSHAVKGERNEELLAHCGFFRVKKWSLHGRRLIPDAGHMRHVLIIAGEGVLECNGVAYPITRGESWLLPATLSELSVSGNVTLLITTSN